MITEGLKCVRCGHELKVEEIQDFDNEIGTTTVLFCPYCGNRGFPASQASHGR